MAGLSGIVKKISDLVTGTPADDDCFVFGKSDLKKITLAKLKDALGITSINSSLAGKIVDKAGNVKFSPAGGKSYGYINVPSGCILLAAYMQEVSGNVSLRLGGFNQSSSTGYTVWVDWDINDSIYLHWIYAKVS